MEKDLKDSLKKMAKDGELWMARSILKWKYKKEGKPVPEQKILEEKSSKIAKEARDVITKRGKNILHELKQVYRDGTSRRGNSQK